ncbi:MAG: hypothetical protein JXA06_14200 [Bacteroidetes bacterium]|nr:hypothetical protein [Bacteroidota bacterium]
MNTYYVVSACLFILLGIIHSYLGERFILVPLIKRGHLPKIFNSELLTARTLRFAWHLTTVAWFAFAVILFFLDKLTPCEIIAKIIAIAAFISFIISLVIARGRHFSWIIFLAVSILIWIGS